MKLKLTEWNRSVFGDVNENVSNAMKKVEQIHIQIDSEGYSDWLFDQENIAQIDLKQESKCQEDFWHEKARVKWHTEGDRNTKFFHQMARISNVTKQINMLKDGDQFLCSAKDIESHVVSFYEKLFCTENNCSDNGLIEEVIPSLVTFEQNLMLTNLPSMEEVKEAVLSMNSDGAPWPDGFGAFFLQMMS